MPTEEQFLRAGGNYSLGVALPVGRATDAGGYLEIADLRSMLKQNVKTLLLTRPGERMMDAEFGVGMRNYLFENFNSGTYEKIRTRIYEQMSRYIPSVTIISIDFDSSRQDEGILRMRFTYALPQIGLQDFLDITI